VSTYPEGVNLRPSSLHCSLVFSEALKQFTAPLSGH
jgi:hypothetical protein